MPYPDRLPAVHLTAAWSWSCRLCPPDRRATGRALGATAAQIDALIHIAATHPETT